MTLVKSKKENQTPSVFSDFFNADRFFTPRWFEKEFEQTIPAVNIKETPKEFDIELAAPGFNKNDFKITVENDMLTISAEREEKKVEEKAHFTRKEFSFNSFTRSFNMPAHAFGDKLTAKYENGLLKLVLPKKEESKPLLKKEFKVS